MRVSIIPSTFVLGEQNQGKRAIWRKIGTHPILPVWFQCCETDANPQKTSFLIRARPATADVGGDGRAGANQKNEIPKGIRVIRVKNQSVPDTGRLSFLFPRNSTKFQIIHLPGEFCRKPFTNRLRCIR